jgi:ABC-type multidrug transport system ATPase subunit
VTAAAPLLRVAGLTKRYGDQLALTEVGFGVGVGEVVGLIGPNGAGKTTVLECLAGLLPADAGTVRWAGTELPPERRKAVLFYLPDGIAPDAGQRVSAVMSFLGRAWDVPGFRLTEAVEALALGPALAKPVGALSKGYRRRLLLALGLLAPQPVLAMDEPFDGLDLRQTREAMALLRREATRGRGLLLSIHQLADAERACDRIVLLAAGRVRGEGTLPELRAAAGLPGGGGGLEEVFLALA